MAAQIRSADEALYNLQVQGYLDSSSILKISLPTPTKLRGLFQVAVSQVSYPTSINHLPLQSPFQFKGWSKGAETLVTANVPPGSYESIDSICQSMNRYFSSAGYASVYSLDWVERTQCVVVNVKSDPALPNLKPSLSLGSDIALILGLPSDTLFTSTYVSSDPADLYRFARNITLTWDAGVPLTNLGSSLYPYISNFPWQSSPNWQQGFVQFVAPIWRNVTVEDLYEVRLQFLNDQGRPFPFSKGSCASVRLVFRPID